MTGSNTIHWHVAGLGAIGALACTQLKLNNHLATPIKRDANSNIPHTFHHLDGESYPLPPAKLLEQCEQISHLFVPLKSYQVIPFLQSIKHKLTANANIVLCHNGMGTIEAAKALLPPSVNLYFCTTNNGAFKKDSEVYYAGAGESYWKLIHQGNTSLISPKQFEHLLPNNVESDDLLTLLWQKLLVNCVINPLTATHNVKNGELSSSQYQADIIKIVEEVCELAKFEHVDLNLNEMIALVYKVIKNTAENTSSMLQDIQQQKQTEIDYISGYVTQGADKHGLSVPMNRLMLEKVLALTSV